MALCKKCSIPEYEQDRVVSTLMSDYTSNLLGHVNGSKLISALPSLTKYLKMYGKEKGQVPEQDLKVLVKVQEKASMVDSLYNRFPWVAAYDPTMSELQKLNKHLNY